jgi:hypothetical protein
MTRKIRWTTLALAAGLVTNVATPERAQAQACTAGPLSAYLASAGLGCTIGSVRMKNFSAPAYTGVANNIFLNPFVLAGPPGFTWVGFSFTGTAPLVENARTISFFAEGMPLYGMFARNDLLAAPNRVRGRVTGDGGYFRTEDWNKRDGSRPMTGCAKYGAAAESCTPGSPEWVGGALADADNGYMVDLTLQNQNDFTVAVLTESVVTPEPASLLLLSTGLGGIGAMVRRRKRRA